MNKLYYQCKYQLSVPFGTPLPEETGFEVAFAGRSNAGKSSAINAITRQKALARVSRTPGRTQAINFFQVDNQRNIIDLPGYGYAKVPDRLRREWDKTLEQYLVYRRSLSGLFLLMDIRHPLQQLDWQLIQWASNANVELHVLLTKADKLSKGAANNQLLQVTRELEKHNVEATLQLFSALKNLGIDDAHTMLDQMFKFESKPS